MNTQLVAEAIMDIEQSNYPYYLVTEIQILESTESEVNYRITITSKFDAKYKIDSGIRKIEFTKVRSYYRDNLIQKILD